MTLIRLTENTSFRQRFVLRDNDGAPLNLIGTLTLRFFDRVTHALVMTMTAPDPNLYVVGPTTDGLVELLLKIGTLAHGHYSSIFRVAIDADNTWEASGPEVKVSVAT